MMEKVVITQEQKDALRNYKIDIDGTVTRELAIFIASNQDWNAHWKPLKDFTPQQFALLLCGWYTVEEPFQVGDWVVDEELNRIGQLEEYNADTFVVAWITGTESFYKHQSLLIRHATPDEIAQEKERRKWQSIGRGVGEYRNGDIAKFDDGDGLVAFGYIYADVHYYSLMREEGSVIQTVNAKEGADAYLTLIASAEQRFDKEDV